MSRVAFGGLLGGLFNRNNQPQQQGGIGGGANALGQALRNRIQGRSGGAPQPQAPTQGYDPNSVQSNLLGQSATPTASPGAERMPFNPSANHMFGGQAPDPAQWPTWGNQFQQGAFGGQPANNPTGQAQASQGTPQYQGNPYYQGAVPSGGMPNDAMAAQAAQGGVPPQMWGGQPISPETLMQRASQPQAGFLDSSQSTAPANAFSGLIQQALMGRPIQNMSANDPAEWPQNRMVQQALMGLQPATGAGTPTPNAAQSLGASLRNRLLSRFKR